MRKRNTFRDCLLSAAVAALPGLCLAGDSEPLRPVTPNASTLRLVPLTPAADPVIQRAGFETEAKTGSTDATDSELQSLFAVNNDVPPVVQLQATPDDSSSIAQVMYKNDSEEETGEKKPKRGLLRRWYQKIAGKDDAEAEANQKPLLDSGQPGVSIPKPPPIDYSIKSSGAAKSTGVPAQPIGYQSEAASSKTAMVGKGQTFVPVPDQPKSSRQTPLRPKRAPNDQFVNPFEPEYSTSQTETLLDLDSLINGKPGTSQAAPSEAPAKTPPTERELPEQRQLDAEPEMKVLSTRKTTDLQSSGPFSGYQLPSDDQVLGFPEDELVEEAIVVEPSGKPEYKVVDADPDTDVIKPAPAKQEPDDAIIRIPLLEEPEMELPPASQVDVPSELKPIQPVDNATSIDQPIQEATVEASPLEVEEFAAEPSIQQPKSLRALDNQTRREQQRYRIMARTGKVGFKGFCPVELRDSRELIDSRERHAAKFGLQTYYFSSPEAVSAFQANPGRYAPAGGGSDVVLLVNTGEETPGTLDFSLWYRDRLYMFRSRETQAIFSSNPRRFADQY